MFSIEITADLPEAAPAGYRQRPLRPRSKFTSQQSADLARLAAALRQPGDDRTKDVDLLLGALADAVAAATPVE